MTHYAQSYVKTLLYREPLAINVKSNRLSFGEFAASAHLDVQSCDQLQKFLLFEILYSVALTFGLGLGIGLHACNRLQVTNSWSI